MIIGNHALLRDVEVNMNNPYLVQKDNIWYCMLPGRNYKKIPYINWVEDIDWSVVYYKVLNSYVKKELSSEQLRDLDIEKILEIAADIRL